MKKNKIHVLDAIEATRVKKPHYNAFAIGHGVHGDTKYNRNKEKRKFKRELKEW